MSLLRSISMSPLHKRRQRRSRLGTLCCEGGPDGMDLREGEGDGDEGKGWQIPDLSICVLTLFRGLFFLFVNNCCLFNAIV